MHVILAVLLMLLMLLMLLGLLTFGEYLSGADFGIDQWLFRGLHAATSDVPPGRMALHTALVLVAINLGILLARPRCGLFGIFTSNTTGGVMARQLLPLASIAPFLIGWLSMQSGHHKLVSFEFGVALVTLTCITVSIGFIWRTAEQLCHSDVQRMTAQALRQ